MPLRVEGPPRTEMKPKPWRVNPRYVAPEWRWARQHIIHEWPMWEAGGGRVRDTGIRGNDLLFVDGSEPLWDKGPKGIQIDVTDSSALYMQTEGTFHPPDVGSMEAFLFHRNVGSGQGDKRFLGFADAFEAKIDGDDLQNDLFQAGGDFTNASNLAESDTIQHLVMSWNLNTNNAEIWLDGEQVATSSLADDDPGSGTLDVGISRGKTGDDYTGRFVLVRFWNIEPGEWTSRVARDPFGPFRPRERDVVQVSLAAIDNSRLADMGFCRGAGQYGPGRLPVPDGSVG